MVWEIHFSMCCFFWLINKETGLAYRIGEGRQSKKKSMEQTDSDMLKFGHKALSSGDTQINGDWLN